MSYFRRELTLSGACGDGTLDLGEACDDGNVVDGDGCQSNCLLVGCGNGLVEDGETCDEGHANSNLAAATCTPTCELPACGDGTVHDMDACDDGNDLDGDGCSSSCMIEAGWMCEGVSSRCITRCGDGIVAGGEECDDGGIMAADGCSPLCQREECGNGIVDPSEHCDDGNMDDTDGCMTDCTLACGGSLGASMAIIREVDNMCVFFVDEQHSYSTARATCGSAGGTLVTVVDAEMNALLFSWANRSGVWIGYNDRDAEGTFVWESMSASAYRQWAPGEPNGGADQDCVRINRRSSNWEDVSCSGRLTFACESLCGNGVSDLGEVCDEGSANSNDEGATCRTNCTLPISALCGDGLLDAGEACDDGNTLPGDLCAADCSLPCGEMDADYNWRNHASGTCFVGYRRTRPWADAELDCAARGGHLATSRDMTENAGAARISAELGNAWLGLTDSDEEGVFVWNSGDPSVVYSAWAPNQPNNRRGNEDCVHMRPDGSWNDARCSSPLGYLCELPL